MLDCVLIAVHAVIRSNMIPKSVERKKELKNIYILCIAVFILSIGTDRPGQIVYTHIRCCRMPHQIRVYTVCHLSRIFDK